MTASVTNRDEDGNLSNEIIQYTPQSSINLALGNTIVVEKLHYL